MKKQKEVKVVKGFPYRDGENRHTFEGILGLASGQEATIIYPHEEKGIKVTAPDKGIEGYYTLALHLQNGIPREYCFIEEWA